MSLGLGIQNPLVTSGRAVSMERQGPNQTAPGRGGRERGGCADGGSQRDVFISLGDVAHTTPETARKPSKPQQGREHESLT